MTMNSTNPRSHAPAWERLLSRRSSAVSTDRAQERPVKTLPRWSVGASIAVVLGLAAGFVAGCVSTDEIETVKRVNVVEDWRDEVIYQLMVDRFANGDVNNDWGVEPGHLGRWQGGDWQGVIDRLDYLEELGVTAIWISPVVRNVEEDAGFNGYHGYWTQAFDQPNPHFGDMAKLREMVDAAHDRDIAVICDVVTNHVGQLFFYDINLNGVPDENTYTNFGDGLEHITEWDPDYDERGVQSFTSLGESGPAPIIFVNYPEVNRVPPTPAEFQNHGWYNRRGKVTSWEADDQVVHGDFPGGLKDLKTELPEVQDALLRAFQFWIDNADFDGFRVDTLKHVEHEFWQYWTPGIREQAASHGKENFFVFGEAFDGDDELIGSFTFDDEMDSAFYFSQKFQAFDAVFKWGGATSGIESLWTQRLDHYGSEPATNGIGVAPQAALVNFMDNHDVSRFLFEQPDVERLHLALAFLLTIDGIPCLYYGTEQAFDGGNDPGNREVLWDTGYDTTGETFAVTRDLIALRKALLPLRRGNLTIRWSTDHTDDEDDAGIFAFDREIDGDRVLVVFNTSLETTSVTSEDGTDMDTGFSGGTSLVDVWQDVQGSHDVAGDGTIRLELPPGTAMILVEESVAASLAL